MDFKLELKKYQELVNEELTKYLRKEAVPESILNHSVEYSLMAGGKRLRPVSYTHLDVYKRQVCLTMQQKCTLQD